MPRGDRGGHGQGPVVDEGLWLRGEESCCKPHPTSQGDLF